MINNLSRRRGYPPAKMRYKENKQENYKKVSCSSCKSNNTIKWCKRKTQNRGLIQRYKCKDCNNTFTIDDGFFRMRNSPQKITLCLDLFYKGVSTREVQNHLQAFYPHNSSWVTIYKWIVRYSKQISKFTDNLKVQVGKEMQIDEMEIGSKKSRYNGWYIDAIDSKTRFMVGSEFTKTREMRNLKAVMGKAKNKTDEQFDVIMTDGFFAYPKAIHKTFTLKKKSQGKKYGVEHNRVNASKGEGFNIKIERLHNSVRHRIKTMRGFHGSVYSANDLMKGFEIYYNFIRKHQALGKTPSELACPELKLNGNKWLNLIQLASQ